MGGACLLTQTRDHMPRGMTRGTNSPKMESSFGPIRVSSFFNKFEKEKNSHKVVRLAIYLVIIASNVYVIARYHRSVALNTFYSNDCLIFFVNILWSCARESVDFRLGHFGEEAAQNQMSLLEITCVSIVDKCVLLLMIILRIIVISLLIYQIMENLLIYRIILRRKTVQEIGFIISRTK